MSRVQRTVAAGLAIALTAIVLVACGSGGDTGASGDRSRPGTAPITLVSDAVSDAHPVTSGVLDLGIRVDAKGATAGSSLSGPLAVRLHGPFASGAEGSLPKLDLDASIELGATKISFGLVSTGDRIWLKYGGTAYLLPSSVTRQYEAAYKRAERRGGEKRTTLSSLGIDPSAWLKDAKVVGDEQIGGDTATHVAADVDVAKLLEDLNGLLERSGAVGKTLTLPQGIGASATAKTTTLSAQMRKDVERSIKSATVDVWVGKDDNLLRRLRVAVSFAVPADVRSSAAGPRSGSFALDAAISELNKHQTIAAPSRARPFSELQPLLSGVLGV
jgi:hypothetical protein